MRGHRSQRGKAPPIHPQPPTAATHPQLPPQKEFQHPTPNPTQPNPTHHTPYIHPQITPPPPPQGHIGLDTAVWPEGTPGCAIDVLARAPLWSMGLNYRHGTGHGVGAALNVHEGPQGIAPRWAGAPTRPLCLCRALHALRALCRGGARAGLSRSCRACRARCMEPERVPPPAALSAVSSAQ